MARARLTQYALADALKISDAEISRRMAGRREFAPHEKQRVSEILGFRPEWLFAEICPPASARLELSGAAV
jgi:plasmid maintenance system antidote protein VapI